MATKIVQITYQLKRGSQSVIEAKNPILAEGEPIVIFCEDGSTKLKIGDGQTPYLELDYVGGTINEDSDGDVVSIEIDDTLSVYSENPVQNKIVTKALNDLTDKLGDKVDKVKGKGLSTNDFTANEKAKLADIEEGANKTVVDTELDLASQNPIQNSTVAQAFDSIEERLNNLTLDGGEIV